MISRPSDVRSFLSGFAAVLAHRLEIISLELVGIEIMLAHSDIILPGGGDTFAITGTVENPMSKQQMEFTTRVGGNFACIDPVETEKGINEVLTKLAQAFYAG